MPDSGLLLGLDGGTATVTISNPAKRNAMTAAMWKELPDLLDRLAADPGVSALVLTGADGTFCAGADIGGLRDQTDPGTVAIAAEEALAAFPKPTLAVVRGACVGGGCQLAVACDLRFAAQGTRFGVTPGQARHRLPRLLHPAARRAGGPGHRQVPAVLRRAGGRRPGAAHRAGRRGAGRRRAGRPGGRLHRRAASRAPGSPRPPPRSSWPSRRAPRCRPGGPRTGTGRCARAARARKGWRRSWSGANRGSPGRCDLRAGRRRDGPAVDSVTA